MRSLHATNAFTAQTINTSSIRWLSLSWAATKVVLLSLIKDPQLDWHNNRKCQCFYWPEGQPDKRSAATVEKISIFCAFYRRIESPFGQQSLWSFLFFTIYCQGSFGKLQSSLGKWRKKKKWSSRQSRISGNSSQLFVDMAGQLLNKQLTDLAGKRHAKKHPYLSAAVR